VIEFNTNAGGIVISNTFADNSASTGGAIQLKTGSSPMFINNIFWGNMAGSASNQVQVEDAACQPGFYYCDIEGGQEGFSGVTFTGDYLFNKDEDPLFTDIPGDPPYMILDGSPCIDMGTPDTSQYYYPEYLPLTCLYGNPRAYNGIIDIGACEWSTVGYDEMTSQPAEISVQAYPNPAMEQLVIAYNLPENGTVSITLWNQMGSCIATVKDGTIQKGQSSFIYNVNNLVPGIYFIRFQSGSECITRKVIKL
jgi:hypothetical protein